MRRTGARSIVALLATWGLAACATPGATSDPLASAIEASGAAEVACSLVSLESAMVALGTESASMVAGPASLDDGTCNWHNTDPQCFMRSLSAAIHVGGDLDQRIDAAVDGAGRVSVIEGVGRRAVLSSEDLPLGSAIEIHHLDVLGDGVWIRYTLSGRLNRDSSRRLLRDLAAQGLASFA